MVSVKSEMKRMLSLLSGGVLMGFGMKNLKYPQSAARFVGIRFAMYPDRRPKGTVRTAFCRGLTEFCTSANGRKY